MSAKTTHATALATLPQDMQERGHKKVSELSREHGALLRRLAQLQSRVSDQLVAATRREDALTATIICLRADVVVLQTGVFWGLGVMPQLRGSASTRKSPPPWEDCARASQTVICQTGCAGHAHPWLTAEGHCRRSGLACEHLGGTIGFPLR